MAVMSSRKVAALIAPVVLAVAAGAVIWARGAEAPAAPAGRTIDVRTVEITRTDLSTTVTLRGQLGYGTPRVLKDSRTGVVTWLPRAGQTLKRGAVVYRVNDVPVPLFYGSVPLYRDLGTPGTAGRDVVTVLRNLQRLGYATGRQPAPPRTGEAVLTTALIAAVKRWQNDVGMPATGVLKAGDLVVLPSSVRVNAVTALVGDSAGGELMSLTPTAKVVTAQVEAADAARLTKGATVTLRLPDGAVSPGKVTAIANVAVTPEGSETGGRQQIGVTIEPAAGVELAGGDVEVKVGGEVRKGVLAVPVNALLALREGGYALQLPDNRLLPVKTGLFAMGLVEVTGSGLQPGLTVVTTS
jgi:peptidoglycan hydrolase-like protein with peptidoglycan-binding domain